MRNTFVVFILIFIILVIAIFMQLESQNTVFIKSDIDGRYYSVKQLPDAQVAANLLAKIRSDLIKFSETLYVSRDKYPKNKAYIERLHERIKNTNIKENNRSYSTSYTINKGDQMVFCIRSKKTNQIHDINVIMYVALHEISHIASPEYGHTELFKNIFAFFIDEASQMGIYKKIDYSKMPVEYCGMMITESV